MLRALALITIIFSIKTCKSLNTLDLNGVWHIKDDSGKFEDLKATVPGGIYSDLMKEKVIGNIFYGYNDTKTKWVPRLNWIYYRDFEVTKDLLNNENVNLVCEGLDTFARIFINNKEVGRSKNMFVRYIFDVKNVLREGRNKLEVRFMSPIDVAADLAEEQEKSYVVPPKCPPNEYRGECNVNMIRKMQASYSWDWGPAFPSVGIWKDIYIESYEESKIRYVASDITDDINNWYLHLDIYLANNRRRNVQGFIKLSLNTDRGNIVLNLDVQLTPNEYQELVISKRFPVPKNYVKEWWPNGYGDQNLYNLTITFSKDGEKSTKTVRIGFRSIELVQEPVGSGLSFYFKVNEVPLFMKGSNAIPLDILPERGQNRDLIKRLLSTVKESNMNMIRVWGGGVYESDYYYDLADEYGILIWQDFMFACAMYPTNADYLENVIEEVRHQVNRLRSHPSIALFAGNNENEAALRQSWYGTANNFTLYYNDFIKLYISTIKKEVDRITHQRRIFLSSSPTNGEESVNEGYVAQNPGDYNFGDVHFYNYVLNPWDSTIYPVSRFASEYGYQALPSINSLMEATSNYNDLDIKSDFMDHRQHHPEGNSQMKELIEFNLKLPEDTSPNYTKAFIYYLQIAQAVGIKIETEHYRRYKGIVTNDGLGNTMGALYWQLNDVWLAPTWSGIDFTGRWKMLQYFVKDFFAPIIITGHINTERILDVYIVSDLLDVIQNVTAVIDVYRWDSLKPINSKEIEIASVESKSNLIQSIHVDQYLSGNNCSDEADAKKNCFFYLRVMSNGESIGPNNYVFAASLKDSNLVKPLVEIDNVTDLGGNVYEVVIKTDNVALFVWLDSSLKGRFTENGFLMVEAQKTVQFISDEKIGLSEFSASLSVTNLLDGQFFGNYTLV